MPVKRFPLPNDQVKPAIKRGKPYGSKDTAYHDYHFTVMWDTQGSDIRSASRNIVGIHQEPVFHG
jgi:hypothetical protein